MLSRFFLICFVFFWNCIDIQAQNYAPGKITIAELEEKMHPKDSGAVAAILASNVTINLNLSGNSEKLIRKKIKIYKSDGYHFSNVHLYFGAGRSGYLNILSAYTYNLVDGKIVKSKLKPESEFIEKTNNSYWIKKLAFPDVKEGSIIEYEYREDVGFLSRYDWSFQENIPVNYSELKTTIPDDFIFKKNMRGFFSPKIITKATRAYGRNATEATYVYQNLPAMKEESYVNNINNYRTGIFFELERVEIPGQLYKTFSSDWTSVAKTIYGFESFGAELNKTGYFEDDLKTLLLGKNNPTEKLTTILDFVKANINWNNHLGFSCEKGVRKAYKEKTGNCADINLMLTAMLRYAGLTANPVLISTRSNGIAFFPNISAFNAVITAVENGDDIILVDAADKFSSPNVLPLRDLNWIGRLIRKDGTSESIDLMPKKMSSNNVSIDYSIEENGKINGKIRRQSTDYNAMAIRNVFSNTKEETYLENLENKNGKIQVSDYKRDNEKEYLLPATESFSFISNDLSEMIGGKIYINPMLFLANTKNPFKQENREYPVDFGFPFAEKYNISIRIPEGFTVESIPKAEGLVMEEGLGIFKYNIALNDNVLQLLILHQINSPIVAREQYGILREYYKVMTAKQTEKIVLKKI
ncbi:transglutaminase [Flavobacterium crocinum]|uniref:Transglutaminase n=1 Tax=Flavobacterium crocinum TaxID=2183896 RepID=A0A2S1YGJ4_9FLAO|nr:DUF3857 domain-containing protein [Flavobacterium crocinum]AWK03163.1 transglutaminase [Flavobacterium crocinum]